MPDTPDPALQAMIEAAQTEEHNARVAALLDYEQNRNIALNIQVRKRDARIAELEQELADSKASE